MDVILSKPACGRVEESLTTSEGRRSSIFLYALI